nr:hypothetical protein [Tanacetum cinerariifolium]
MPRRDRAYLHESCLHLVEDVSALTRKDGFKGSITTPLECDKRRKKTRDKECSGPSSSETIESSHLEAMDTTRKIYEKVMAEVRKCHTRMKVADWIDNGIWSWPNDWIRRFKDVLDVVLLLNESQDKAIWFNKKNDEKRFSVNESCKVIKVDMPSVLWYKHVCKNKLSLFQGINFGAQGSN